jgi:hypothetical protein
MTNSHQVEDLDLVMRILIANIADKDALLVVPALEVATSQLQHRFRGFSTKGLDVLFGDVTDGLVADPVSTLGWSDTWTSSLTLRGRKLGFCHLAAHLRACSGSSPRLHHSCYPTQ